jgi:hypothetical protein
LTIIFEKKKTTFIKMDLEGYEELALLGAKETIKRDKPKLAISIYHGKDDYWKLPNIILDADSEYRFYIRHYTLFNNETVLYGYAP